jgi:ankyrin repeat protein
MSAILRKKKPIVLASAEELGERLHDLCHDDKNAPSAAAMQSLIARGANVNWKDLEKKMTALHWATFRRHLNAVKMLLATGGIDICAKNMIGNTAFELACIGGHVEIAMELLAAHKKASNFDINDTDDHGSTALMHACMFSRARIVKLLLSIPNINTRLIDSGGDTALDLAEGEENEDEIRALFQGELLPSSSFELARENECSVTLNLLFSSFSRTISPLIHIQSFFVHSFFFS